MFNLGALAVRALLVVAGLGTAVAHAGTISEDFSTDPGWTGLNNTGYGFSNTGNVTGNAGEIGGVIPGRANVQMYYADTTLGGASPTYGLNDAITATGSFIVTDAAGFNGSVDIGFFNSSTWDPAFSTGYAESMMFRIIDPGPNPDTTTRWFINLGSSLTSSSELVQVGTQYHFELAYDPTGVSASVGLLTGKLFLASDGSQVGTTLTRTITTTGTNWALNTFGISQTATTGLETVGVTAFFDDVTYTGEAPIPEPGTMVLSAIGFLLVGLTTRRSEKFVHPVL